MKFPKAFFSPVRFVADTWNRLMSFLEQQDKLVTLEERQYADDAEIKHWLGQ